MKTSSDRIPSEDTERYAEEDAFLEHAASSRSRAINSRSSRLWQLLPWGFVGGLALLNVGQFMANGYSSRYSYESGFETELSPVRSTIRVIEQQFEGGLHIHADKSFSRVGADSETQYVGTPSPAIDDAWAALTAGLNFDLEGDEAETVRDSTYQWEGQEKWFSGLELFHSLHCLNHVRKALYPDYYSSGPAWREQPSKPMHLDHCIDHIRQLIQCHADLTPMNWQLRNDSIILETDTMRTCRDFSAIQDWAKERKTALEAKSEIRGGEKYVVD